MHQRRVIAALEINLRLLFDAVVDNGIETVAFANWGNVGNTIAGDPAGLGAMQRRLGRFVRNRVIGDVLGSQIFFECRGNGHIPPSSATGKPRSQQGSQPTPHHARLLEMWIEPYAHRSLATIPGPLVSLPLDQVWNPATPDAKRTVYAFTCRVPAGMIGSRCFLA